MKQTDVIIIGAGPAGCATAIRARQAGLSVLMFDVNPYPKVVPGETLHPGIEPIFKQLNVLDQVLAAKFRRHLGIWIQKDAYREFLPYGEDQNGPWLGFQVDRQKFHQILQRAAMKTGISLIRSATPSHVLRADEQVIGVEVNGSKYLAHWTIDATGRSAWLAKQLGIEEKIRSPTMKARFGWRTDCNSEYDEPLFLFQKDGWDWQAPLGNDQVAWVELRLSEVEDTPTSGVDLTWKYRPDCAGPGFFLVGDAAANLDPSSSHGVLRALMSGILCSHLIEGFQQGKMTEEEVAKSYQIWLSQQFRKDEMLLHQYYLDSPVGDRFVEALY